MIRIAITAAAHYRAIRSRLPEDAPLWPRLWACCTSRQ
jgi:hypothetical protein